jgi:hypothetical protein
MKKVKETMNAAGASEDEVKEFEKGASGFAKKIVGNFKDYEFLIGPSMDPDAMYVSLHLKLLVNKQANIISGLFSSTIVRTVPPPTLPCGSTASSPPRCKRFFSNMLSEKVQGRSSESVYEAALELCATSDIPGRALW